MTGFYGSNFADLNFIQKVDSFVDFGTTNATVFGFFLCVYFEVILPRILLLIG